MVLTKSDFNALKDLMEVTIEEKLEAKLTEKLKYLPTKDEFYEQSAKIMKELKEVREEITVLSGRSSEDSDRIEELERIHSGGMHAALAS